MIPFNPRLSSALDVATLAAERGLSIPNNCNFVAIAIILQLSCNDSAIVKPLN